MDGRLVAKVQPIRSWRQQRSLEKEHKAREQPAEEWQVAADLSGGPEKSRVTFAGKNAERWNAAVGEAALFFCT